MMKKASDLLFSRSDRFLKKFVQVFKKFLIEVRNVRNVHLDGFNMKKKEGTSPLKVHHYYKAMNQDVHQVFCINDSEHLEIS